MIGERYHRWALGVCKFRREGSVAVGSGTATPPSRDGHADKRWGVRSAGANGHRGKGDEGRLSSLAQVMFAVGRIAAAPRRC